MKKSSDFWILRLERYTQTRNPKYRGTSYFSYCVKRAKFHKDYPSLIKHTKHQYKRNYYFLK